MARNKALDKYTKLVAEYGCKVEHGGKHYSILHNGARVGTLSGTGEQNALRQSIRDLARQGIFGENEAKVRKIKF